MLAAQSNGDESGRRDEERRMHDLRAELLRRLTRAAEPDAGRVTISVEDAAYLARYVSWKSGSLIGQNELIMAALAQAGAEGETE
jgi:hypothetical protein